jgi:hypothetical protein
MIRFPLTTEKASTSNASSETTEKDQDMMMSTSVIDVEQGGGGAAVAPEPPKQPSYDVRKKLFQCRHRHEAPLMEEEEDDAQSNCTSNTYSLRFHNGHHQPVQNNKWLFVVAIVLIGGACAGAFLALGIIGANSDATKNFEQRATELTFAIESVAHDYELFGLW